MSTSPAVPLAELMVATAKAVQGAQRNLDQQLVYSPPVAATIPRVTVNGEYDVRTVAGKTALIFGHKQEENTGYQVAFTLRLAPTPMPPIELQSEPNAVLLVPPFLEQAPVVGQIVRDLCATLESINPSAYRDEVSRLRAAAANQSDDPGLAAFRLDNTGALYFIARIGGRRDGLFLFDRTAPAQVTVINHWNSSSDTVPWAPFHLLFEMLRGWQRRRTAARLLEGPAPSRIGGIQTTDFLSAMWNAYGEARTLLSSPDGTAIPGLPAYYHIDDIGATLSYSVPRTVSKPPDERPPLVRSDLLVKTGMSDGVPRIELTLRSPEFILVDAQRDAVLDLLRQNLDASQSDVGKDSFYRVVDAPYRQSYDAALRDSSRAGDALVLLSYVDKPPKNEFLFVWTGVISAGSEERDFAFRFGLDDDRLVNPELVLPLEDPVEGSTLGTEDRPFSLAQVAYNSHHSGLHDFLHAAWIWTEVGKWYPL